MPRLVIAREDELLVASASNPLEEWATSTHLPMTMPVALAGDPKRPSIVYCGTMGSGVWRSTDAGESWVWVGEGLPEARITALAVSAVEDAMTDAVVYVGTEPSAVYRSDNGGQSWQPCGAFDDLPSAPEWRFPPRPDTHHVRWITCDPHREGWLYVAIEAGALIRSRDGGATWMDRTPDGPRDTHTMAAHPRAAGRLYAAAGDGYFESRDYGDHWTTPDTGLDVHYLWGLALDPGDPDRGVVSGSPGPSQAHAPEAGYSMLFHRVPDGRWLKSSDGAPPMKGTIAHVLVSNPMVPGAFYAVSNRGVVRSADGGTSWRPTSIPWSDDDRRRRVRAVALIP